MHSKARKVIRIGIPLGDRYAMGPGKAELLEAIQAAGSIAGAGRQLGMSYRRAWLLVDEMNKCFRTPLVESRLGGVRGGGAQVTELGLEALARYRELQGLAWEAIQRPFQAFERLLGPPPAPEPARKRPLD